MTRRSGRAERLELTETLDHSIGILWCQQGSQGRCMAVSVLRVCAEQWRWYWGSNGNQKHVDMSNPVEH
jgi:hypothetical protein